MSRDQFGNETAPSLGDADREKLNEKCLECGHTRHFHRSGSGSCHGLGSSSTSFCRCARFAVGSPGLSTERLAALAAWREAHGHFWRARLYEAWEKALYPGVASEHGAVLQEMRNALGPRWLSAYRPPKNAKKDRSHSIEEIAREQLADVIREKQERRRHGLCLRHGVSHCHSCIDTRTLDDPETR